MLQGWKLLLLSLLLCVNTATAEVFHYVTDSGRKVYVNSLHKVPAEYRDQIKVREEASAGLDASEQADRAAKRQQEALSGKVRREIRRLEDTLAKMRTPVIIRGNQVVVPVRLVAAGRRADVNLVLDTGASITVLHQNAVSRLPLNQREKSLATVAGGGQIELQRVILDRVEFGPYVVNNKPAAVIESSGQQLYDGLLGLDLLANSGYKINFQAREIIWNETRFEELSEQLELLRNPPEEDTDSDSTDAAE